MKKQVAKSLLAIGLSFSIINCGGVEESSQDNEGFEAQTVAIERIDIEPKSDAKSDEQGSEANVVLMPYVEVLPDSNAGDAKTMRSQVVVADSVKPIAIKAEGLYGATAKVTYQLLETPDFKPAVDIELDSDTPVDLIAELPDFADGMLSISELEPMVNALEFDESVEAVSVDRFWNQALAVEGIYQLNRHDISLNTCDVSAVESLEGLEEFAVLKALKMGDGTPYLLAVSGESVADAEEKIEDMMAGQSYRSDFSFVATELGVDGLFRGQAGVAGFPNDEGNCEAGSVTETLLGVANGSLKLEARKVKVKDAEQDINGECSFEHTVEASTSSECSSLEILTGDWVQNL